MDTKYSSVVKIFALLDLGLNWTFLN